MASIDEAELNEFVEPPFNRNGYASFHQMLPTLDSFHTLNGLPRHPGTFDRTIAGIRRRECVS